MRERQIHDGLIAFLRKERLSYIHHRMDKKSGIASGWPDFTIVHCGRALLIEIKTGSGKLSRTQKQVIADLKRNGTPTMLVYSVEEAVAAVMTWMGIEQEPEGITREEKSNAPVPFLESHAEEFQELKGKLLPGAGSDVQPGDRSKLFIGNWNGHEAVFKRNGRGATFLHVADKHDLETLPRGNQ